MWGGEGIRPRNFRSEGFENRLWLYPPRDVVDSVSRSGNSQSLLSLTTRVSAMEVRHSWTLCYDCPGTSRRCVSTHSFSVWRSVCVYGRFVPHSSRSTSRTCPLSSALRPTDVRSVDQCIRVPVNVDPDPGTPATTGQDQILTVCFFIVWLVNYK